MGRQSSPERALDHALALAAVRRRLPAPDVRRALRERAGVTQAQLALALGISRSALQRWEAGQRSPRRRYLAAYAAALAHLARAVAADGAGTDIYDGECSAYVASARGVLSDVPAE